LTPEAESYARIAIMLSGVLIAAVALWLYG
jgi:hypothetical protein